MKKEGQIAIFVILAIVLVASVGVYFFIAKPEVFKTTIFKTIPEKLDSPLYAYVNECIESAIYDSFEIFGLQQGYYESSSKSLDTGFTRIDYYYLEGAILIPETSFFEKELAKIINDKISESCSDFSIFEEDGYYINANIERINSETKISEDKVEVNVDYPVFITTNGSSTGFSEFSYEIPARLGHIIDVSRILVEKIKENPGETDLTFLLNQDVGISIDNYDECNKIYILIDEQSQINNEPFAFSFAAGFEEQYCSGGNQ
ncbi:hypothetical protein HYT25_02955 [Candidatus Pacearchaeota archaeon]|nr:hypothetical protein [Candidatus Pacearchaeota archaeon]